MGLESAAKITDLNPLWPLGTDPKSQGDDHIRLLKTVMKGDAVAKSGDTMTGDLRISSPAGTTTSSVISLNDGSLVRKGFLWSEATGRVSLSCDAANSAGMLLSAGNSGDVTVNSTGGVVRLTSLSQQWIVNGATWTNYPSGGPAATAVSKLQFAGAGSGYGVLLWTTSTASSNQMQFLNGASPGTVVGSITTSASATAFNTSSDERLKTFTGPLTGDEAAAIIRADPVRHFTWNADGSEAVGWGAQTSYEVSHDLASPPVEDLTKDVQPGVGEDGFQPWGMDQAKRTPYLWAALAWALDRIDQLESRIGALEA